MRVVVTGAAGFIGSHVAEAMAEGGHDVFAVDAPGRSATPVAARRNWAALAGRERIRRVEADLVTAGPAELARLVDAAVVVHLAGRPGVRSSWGDGEADTWRDNVEATRRLLAACGRGSASPAPRVVIASSSSVYGSATGPCAEDAEPHPESPYARAKLAVERLAAAAGPRVPTVVLRYFSVYGPRQRPDMAFHRFIEAALDGRPAPVYGDGGQCRSFTYVADVVHATLLAAATPLPPATVINIGHPDSVPVRHAVDRISALLACPLPVARSAPAPGDVARTWAAAGLAGRLLGWAAGTGLDEGLARQIAWHRSRRAVAGGAVTGGAVTGGAVTGAVAGAPDPVGTGRG